MSLRVIPDVLAAAYEYLRTTEPFKGWKMPEADDVGFHALIKSDSYGSYDFIGGVHTIKINVKRNDDTAMLMSTMAHEMIHLRQQLLGHKDHHGPRFMKMAKKVCDVHGFNLEIF